MIGYPKNASSSIERKLFENVTTSKGCVSRMEWQKKKKMAEEIQMIKKKESDVTNKNSGE